MLKKSLDIDKLEGEDAAIASAVALLRQRTGKSQEQIAREIGCSLGAFSRWERGERTPRGKWLLKIMALAPDDETRAAFSLKSEISNLQSVPPPPAPPVRLPAPGDDIEAVRYFNDAVEGISLGLIYLTSFL